MSLVPITWTSLVNTIASPNPNDLIKNAGGSDGFNAGAISNNTLVAATEGSGISFYFLSGTYGFGGISCGLSSTNSDISNLGTDFALQVGSTNLYVYESGTLMATHAAISETDVLSLIFMGGKIDYRINGVSFYTSLASPAFPLFVKGSIRNQNDVYYNATISDVNIIQPPPAAPTNLTTSCVSGISESTLPQSPVASCTASVNSGAAPLTVTFSDTSLHVPTSWLYEFGDGTTSTSQNPTHVFQEGIWTVRLTATNAYGSSAYALTIFSEGAVIVAPPSGGIVVPAGILAGETLASLLGKIGYYAVDTPNNVVTINGSDGTLLETFGGTGTAPGKFFMPTTCSVVGGKQLLDRVNLN